MKACGDFTPQAFMLFSFIGKCIDYDFDLTYVWFKECGFLGEFNRGTLMYRCAWSIMRTMIYIDLGEEVNSSLCVPLVRVS